MTHAKTGEALGSTVVLDKNDISEEIDVPFGAKSPGVRSDNLSGIKEIQLRHTLNIDKLKHNLAVRLIFVALGYSLLCAVVDIFFKPDSAIFTSSFEMAKLIGMTALGFVFGVKQ